MQISVSGKSLDIGDSLKVYVENRLASSVKKYFDNAIDASVVFSKESHNFKADLVVNEGVANGVFIKSNGQAGDIYASFDQAAERVEKQLRRYKNKLKGRHRKKFNELSKAELDLLEAKKFVITEKEEEHLEEDNPIIIAEKPMRIETLSVSEAVMEMNLQNLPALVFINKLNNRINVVYHRKDGNISWIDPEIKGKK